MKDRSNSNASNASNSSFGNSFDQSPLSAPPALNDVPLYKPQSSAAPKQQQPQPSRPAVAPKPKTTTVDAAKNSIDNEMKANKVDTGATSSDVTNAQQSIDEENKPELPLPSYNDVMKEVDDTIVEDETTLEEGAEVAGPPLPSYNDIMKDIENKSPTTTTDALNQDSNEEEQKTGTEDA